MPRRDFTDAQRAQIFARDRALCSYSGKSLWLLDYGAVPPHVDWVDHIEPIKRGGECTLENGACASWLYNSIKRDYKSAHILFCEGRPTADFYTYFETIPQTTAEHLRRFARLVPSDWFFNRAMFHLLQGANQVGAKRLDGLPPKRGIPYRAAAALRFLECWRKLSGDVANMRSRGLIPKQPSVDQRLLLAIVKESSDKQVGKLILKLAPYVHASWRALELLASIKSLPQAQALRRVVIEQRYVIPRVKRIVRSNLAALDYEDEDT